MAINDRRMMVSVTILFGSNYGDKKNNIINGAKLYKREFTDWEMSQIYESDAEGSGVGRYCNAVARGYTDNSLEQLEVIAKNIERSMGRDAMLRAQHLVPIDIDVVIYGDVVVRIADSKREYFIRGCQYLEARK